MQNKISIVQNTGNFMEALFYFLYISIKFALNFYYINFFFLLKR